MGAAVVAAVFLLLFLLFEGRSRVGESARSLDAGPEDRGSTRRVGAAFGVSIVTFALSSFLAMGGYGALPSAAAWAGFVVMTMGIGFRLWSARVLGASYTRTLRVDPGQQVVRAGPYRLVRHPGYAGSIMLWTGAAFASGDIFGPLVIVPLIVWAYVMRIVAEDRLLIAALGDEYATYARDVARLVPFIY